MPGVANPQEMLVSYGPNFTFPVSMKPIDSALKPVWDQAGRVVVAHEYSFTLSCVLYPESDDEDDASRQMELVRQQLTKEADVLKIIGVGFGGLGNDDFIVNSPGGRVWDLKWGPHPDLEVFKQIGSSLAWEVVWTVTTTLAPCPEESMPGKGRAMEWNYKVSWDVNEKGLTTRSVSGHVTIPLTRFPGPDVLTVKDSADSLRESVKDLLIPAGFRRIPGRSDLSEDRRTLTFSLQDVQFENQYCPPPGVILVTARHDFTTAQYNWFKATHTLSATYTAARDYPKSVAWTHFTELYLSRRAAAEKAGQTFIPLILSGGETPYDTVTTFNLRYLVMGHQKKADAQRLLALLPFRQGLWTPVPSSSWGAWVESVGRTAMHSRGYAGMKFDPADDYLLSLCQPPGDKLTNLSNKTREYKLRNVELGRKPNLPPGDPDPEDSWLQYRVRLRILQRDDNVVLKLLPTTPVEAGYKPRRGDVMNDKLGGFIADYAPPPPGTERRVVQFRSEADYRVVLEGEAIRVGHAISNPVLTEVGGVKAFPVNDDGDHFSQEIVANAMLTPIAVATWRQAYVLLGTPRKPIGPPDNPTIGSIGRTDNIEGFVAGV